MTRFQIYIDETQVSLINRLAAQKQVSRSYIIRSMIANQTKKLPKKLICNPLREMTGLIKGLPKDLSQRVDEIYRVD